MQFQGPLCVRHESARLVTISTQRVLWYSQWKDGPLPASSDMTNSRSSSRTAALAAISMLLLAGSAPAQEQRGSGNFLDDLFSRGQPAAQSRQPAQSGRMADPGDLSVRLDRMENALRQLTGTIEQLQYRNQQLEMQLKRMQDDTEYRLQQLGSRGGAAPPQAAPMGPGNASPGATPGRRSDVFDPSQNPNAPGAPRTLGNGAVIAAPERSRTAGRRSALLVAALPARRWICRRLPATMSTPPQAPVPPAAVASAGPTPVPTSQVVAPSPSPPPQVRNAVPSGQQLATLPPSASPQDEYDMAYGYVLHKDYALAEQSFRDYLKKYPNERLVPEAQYWLGESLFQQQRYRDAAESFLGVSTKFERSAKAPDALLRLGQSLAAMNRRKLLVPRLPRSDANIRAPQPM